MTRINLVDVGDLSPEHLMAEYRELPRIFTNVRKMAEKGDLSDKQFNNSPTYILGAGHVKFFYNKLHFLLERYVLLHNELIARNFNLNEETYCSIISSASIIIRATENYQIMGWSPSPKEKYLNMARLCLRSNVPEVLDELNKGR